MRTIPRVVQDDTCRGRRPTAPAGPAAAATAVAVAVAWAAAGCGGGAAGARGGPPPVPVVAGQVVRKTMPVTFRAIGNVEAVEAVAVKARVGGELQRVWFVEGQRVRAGETLFTIDQRPYQAALAQAEALLAHDQALLAKAEEDARRYAGLVEKDFVTREQYAQINANAAALRAAVAGDRARVDAAKLDLSFCTIVAPVAGRTGRLAVKAGALIKANDDKAIVTINQIDPIHVAFAVPARHLPAVLSRRAGGIGVRAAVPHDPAPPAEGELFFVDNAVDTATGTVLLKAVFDNRDERLWPGQFVDVTVVLGEEPDRVVCPAPAVQTGQQGQYVFVIGADDTVEMREVSVDRGDERETVIAAGLAGGETVVTDGQLRLVPGAKVVRRGSVAPAGGGS
jgi:multidrug efflux system membrane fusion protein